MKRLDSKSVFESICKRTIHIIVSLYPFIVNVKQIEQETVSCSRIAGIDSAQRLAVSAIDQYAMMARNVTLVSVPRTSVNNMKQIIGKLRV